LEDFISGGQTYNCSLKESSDHFTAVPSGEVRTGIRIRTRQPQNPLTEGVSLGGYVAQGTAPRRLRLQCKLQVSADWSGGPEDHESKPITTEVRSLLCETCV
jgi:hypothetical protein